MKKCLCLLLSIVLIFSVISCGRNDPTWQEQYDLGVRYLSEGSYDEAIIAFNAAIEIEPKRADAYVGLADAYIALGNYAEAMTVLENALEQVDDLQLIQKKQEEVQDLIAQEESEYDPGQTDGDIPAEDLNGEVPKNISLPTGQESKLDETPDETLAESPVQEPEEEPVPEEIIQNPVEEPAQEEPVELPQSYTEYQYAVDVVNSATLWDVYQTMEQKGYGLMDWDSSDGYSMRVSFDDAGGSKYLTFYCVMSDEMREMEFTEPVSTEEMLSMCSSCSIFGVGGSYDGPWLEISPAFSAGMTYDEMIQACENNGYRYNVRENPAISETYLEITLGSSIGLSFTWDNMEPNSTTPVFFSIGDLI